MADVMETKTTEHEVTPLRVGLDIGSTTVKAVVLDKSSDLKDVLFADYRRHNANVRATVAGLLRDVKKQLEEDGRGCQPINLAITGSGGLGLADDMNVPFVQEVIAETKAIDQVYPEADVIIELGGEDAKITYLKPTPEQRMNGSCAGGTGAFIDQMATLLDTDASGLNDMAKNYKILYPIASRCGVFAKSDLQPLINDGADKPDLAASIFTAVATQTIAGLASGRPIHGNVVFLGGPLFFLSELREAFARALEGKVDRFIVPENAHLYVAYGSALMCGDDNELDVGQHFEPRSCQEIIDDLEALKNKPVDTATMPPLFPTEEDRREFNERHHKEQIKVGTLEGAKGPHFLGIDAGSTTIKATLINDDREIVWSSYGTNDGSPLDAAVEIVRKIENELPAEAWIARSCATGYGEGLITTGLHLDEGVVETMAHYRGAEMVSPGVTAVIDIGGQDMKYLAIADGVIDSISVNEACSSGCGSFLQTFAYSMGLTIEEFTHAALRSDHPVDLGSRCTVFMNSSVKQAQKEGATVENIAAGLCYSVVRNALYKVIKLRDSGQLGDTIEVQGGTFLNDAVLRAFELLTGKKVTRPNIAGLMGAFGAALTARMHYEDAHELDESAEHTKSAIVEGDELDHLSMTSERDVCKRCQNRCKLTITTFQDGSRYVTGNRCERGADAKAERSDRPNLYDYKYKRVFAYRRLTDKKAYRGEIGIPRALNMYENYPFWFTLLTNLGFKVRLSGRSSHELFQSGIESIASENICYPAKMVHGHIKWLLDRGVKTIFYPCVSYEENLVEGDTDNHYNCPIVANYPVVIEANMAELREPGIRYMRPYFNLADHELMVDRIVEEFAWTNVTREEAEKAVKAAYAEDKIFKHDVQQEGLRALAYMKEHDCRGIVLAGRPYHIDPEINHGIPETICSLGMVVLSEDSICELQPGQNLHLSEFLSEGEKDPRAKDEGGFREVGDRKVINMPLRVANQWAYHSRLYAAANFVASYPGLELVQLNSFGCGIDAITTDQVSEILADKADVYTLLKIDEVSNLGAAKIRLRSLKAAIEEREANKAKLARAAAKAEIEAKPAGDADNQRVVAESKQVAAEERAESGADEMAKQAAEAKAREEAAAKREAELKDAESKLEEAKAQLAAAQAAVDAAENKAETAKQNVAASAVVDSTDSSDDSDNAEAPAAHQGEFRKTGSKAPTPGRQVLLDSVMKANPKLTESMKEASRRANGKGAAAGSAKTERTNVASNAGKSTDGKDKKRSKGTISAYAHKVRFEKTMRRDYTIVAPQMSPVHMSLVEAVIRSGGYKFDVLKMADQQDVETGLKYVNNDACYPAIMVVGQLVDSIIKGKYDPDKVCLAITQTGGMCRATNYYGLIRKALVDAGYPQVPVIALSTQGIEDNPGFTATPTLLWRAVKALVIGDLLMKCHYRVRPYEKVKGSANKLYEMWDKIVRETIEHHGHSATAKRKIGKGYLPYQTLLNEIVKSFDALPLRNIPRKPRVGVVGEILVKYHPDANNHLVDQIEEQGCEAVVPGIMEFMTTRPYITDWNEKNTGMGGNKKLYALMRWGLDRILNPVRRAIDLAHGKFSQDTPMPELVKMASTVTSIGVQAGEGWLLTAEILELIKSGCPNVVCAQPFACLPNHVTGRGMFGKIRRLHPEANIVSIDYDPGASAANQLNRIKLMIAAAKKADQKLAKAD
ncbi:acyl-CoA dehydratase activase-related protein [Bifidobacterium sp. ESL0800]|uniref:acyl-CoA dehydratase activase-related protein n=1 Tax=Bifidobacterium sp. ESL0800 TaxID=2983236 RepID=UPI0023F996AE|nr:acyl-CoA dehydratase activase-related protein [Bifidobacterium sp. ESL0800]WEV75049.1 acyl-CoA dehydratase activase-related protein [Bifidobacterium sp. ESL0800]